MRILDYRSTTGIKSPKQKSPKRMTSRSAIFSSTNQDKPAPLQANARVCPPPPPPTPPLPRYGGGDGGGDGHAKYDEALCLPSAQLRRAQHCNTAGTTPIPTGPFGEHRKQNTAALAADAAEEQVLGECAAASALLLVCLLLLLCPVSYWAAVAAAAAAAAAASAAAASAGC